MKEKSQSNKETTNWIQRIFADAFGNFVQSVIVGSLDTWVLRRKLKKHKERLEKGSYEGKVPKE